MVQRRLRELVTVPLSWANGGTGGDVAWSYEAPHAAVAAIAGHLAFYGERVDAIALLERD